MDWDYPFQEERVKGGQQNEDMNDVVNQYDVDEDEESRDRDDSFDASLQKAEELFDFIEVPTQTCHCSCMLGEDETPCIQGFTLEDQDFIR